MTEASRSLGDVLRTAREAAGWSLSRMATSTGYSKPYLSKLETGAKEVRRWHIQAYDRALGGDAVRRQSAMIMGMGTASPEVWATLDLPVALPDRVTSDDLVALNASTEAVTSLGLRHGGRASVAAGRGLLAYAIELLGVDMPGSVRTSLLTTTARLADRTAWSMADTGRVRPAEHIYNFALATTQDHVQRQLTLVNLANLRLDDAQPARAFDALDRADAELPVLRFLVSSTRAHAYASLGDFGGTVRYVEHADIAHAAVDLEDLPEAIRPYASGHEAHAHSAAGRAYAALARSGRPKAIPLAVERLQAAIEAFGPERRHAIAGCEDRLEGLT